MGQFYYRSSVWDLLSLSTEASNIPNLSYFVIFQIILEVAQKSYRMEPAKE